MNEVVSPERVAEVGEETSPAIAQIYDEGFSVREVRFDDRKITGAQIAEAARVNPVEDYVILHQLPTFELETLRPVELADLRKSNRFFVIKGDGTERFSVDGINLEWPRKVISGLSIKRLVGKDGDDLDLYLEREDLADRLIDDDDEVRLGAVGVEKFKLRPAKVDIKIIVNGRTKEWAKRRISFTELVELAYPVPPTGQCIVYTITFHQGPPHRPEGTLTEGQSVRVREGMVFNVRFTDKS